MGKQPDFDTVVASLQERQTSLTPVLIQNHRAIRSDVFRVWFTPVGGQTLETAAATAGLSQALGEKFSVVAGTVGLREADSRTPVYSALVVPNSEVKPYNPETVGEMRAVEQANVFADAGDVMWKKVTADGQDWLVQVSQEDYDAMLRQRRRGVGQPVLAAVDENRNSSGICLGQYCSYYHPGLRRLEGGFLITHNDQLVVASDTGLVPVEEAQLVAGSAQATLSTEQARFRGDAQKVIDFFKQIWGENSAMMARLRQLLQQAD